MAPYDDLSDRSTVELALAVNFFGPYAMTQAFLPQLTRSRGALVNNVSLMALAPLPLTPSYAISKAAAFNMTQSLRALLAGQGRERPRRLDRAHGHRDDRGVRDPQGDP